MDDKAHLIGKIVGNTQDGHPIVYRGKGWNTGEIPWCHISNADYDTAHGRAYSVEYGDEDMNFPANGDHRKHFFEIVEKTYIPETPVSDMVNHPPHYTSHPSGVECIQVTEHMGFNLGNAMKYVWRADLKGSTIQDLEKAKWYIEREIQKRQKA